MKTTQPRKGTNNTGVSETTARFKTKAGSRKKVYNKTNNFSKDYKKFKNDVNNIIFIDALTMLALFALLLIGHVSLLLLLLIAIVVKAFSAAVFVSKHKD